MKPTLPAYLQSTPSNTNHHTLISTPQKHSSAKFDLTLSSTKPYLHEPKAESRTASMGLKEKETRVVEMREKLKNLHHFYKIRIEEERNANIERNQIFIGIIEELQKIHQQKLTSMQESVSEAMQEKNDMNYVDERMGNIKVSIQSILSESKELKKSNDGLENEIMHKQQYLKEKQLVLEKAKQELDGVRNELEQFERMRLKENRKKKEMIDLIESNLGINS